MIVKTDKDGEKQEELEVTRDVPSPWKACVLLGPRDNVVKEHNMPEPVL